MKTAKRYTTTLTNSGNATLTDIETGDVREFWVRGDRDGYVYEIYDGRPGTLGQQVCDRLEHSGSTLSCRRSDLLSLIRREARALYNSADDVTR